MPLDIGDEAPNFDLSSSEDALLMLRDEVARTPVVLYVFGDGGDPGVRQDLAALAAARPELAKRRAKVLAVAKQKLDELKRLQVELKLSFPLLHDDRDFCAAYGVASGEDGAAARPALLLVGRDQRVLWQAGPATSATAALGEILAKLDGQELPSATYPQSVVNRFIGRGVKRAAP